MIKEQDQRERMLSAREAFKHAPSKRGRPALTSDSDWTNRESQETNFLREVHNIIGVPPTTTSPSGLEETDGHKCSKSPQTTARYALSWIFNVESGFISGSGVQGD